MADGVVTLAFRARVLPTCSALLITLGSMAAVRADVLPRLPALALERASLTVSGLSSGGYMAGQFEVAYSSSVAGAAVLAGGPYGCARGSLSNAMLKCSCPAEKHFMLSLSQVFGGGCQSFNPGVYFAFSKLASEGNRAAIDAVSHLKDHRIWLLSGGKDEVVDRDLVDATEAFYRHLQVPDARIRREHIAGAGHGFPTLQATEACSSTRTPFLTRCNFDAAGELIKWLYPDVAGLQAGSVATGSFKQFKQTRYAGSGEFDGMDSTGWLYVPKACEQAGAQCRLHVVFHGCEQGQSYVVDGKAFDTKFVKGAGYNRWAEAGRIVVLYPQVRPSSEGSFTQPYRFNPKGCWDFWGYTDKDADLYPTAPNYAKRSAPQMKAVKAMIDDLVRSP